MGHHTDGVPTDGVCDELRTMQELAAAGWGYHARRDRWLDPVNSEWHTTPNALARARARSLPKEVPMCGAIATAEAEENELRHAGWSKKATGHWWHPSLADPVDTRTALATMRTAESMNLAVREATPMPAEEFRRHTREHRILEERRESDELVRAGWYETASGFWRHPSDGEPLEKHDALAAMRAEANKPVALQPNDEGWPTENDLYRAGWQRTSDGNWRHGTDDPILKPEALAIMRRRALVEASRLTDERARTMLDTPPPRSPVVDHSGQAPSHFGGDISMEERHRRLREVAAAGEVKPGDPRNRYE